MDENGYYRASYNDRVGKVPANFIQEIEVYDEELINRVTNQVTMFIHNGWRTGRIRFYMQLPAHGHVYNNNAKSGVPVNDKLIYYRILPSV